MLWSSVLIYIKAWLFLIYWTLSWLYLKMSSRAALFRFVYSEAQGFYYRHWSKWWHALSDRLSHNPRLCSCWWHRNLEWQSTGSDVLFSLPTCSAERGECWRHPTRQPAKWIHMDEITAHLVFEEQGRAHKLHLGRRGAGENSTERWVSMCWPHPWYAYRMTDLEEKTPSFRVVQRELWSVVC